MSEATAAGVMHKIQRLGSMRPNELAHRVREKLYSEVERASAGMGTGLVRAAAAPFKHYLAGSPASRFYVSGRQCVRGWVRENYPQWIERAVEEAEKLCRHEVALLGLGPVQLGAEIDWHRDPATGRVWDRRFWADYRPVEDNGGRDPKIIHELNRHQHLPRLAKAYRLTGDERYAREAVRQLNGWIEQNPPGRGINWQSSLEIGMRALSWMWTIFPLLPSRAFDETSAQRIGDSLFAQLAHVYKYTSVFSSPNTHLIGEAAALFIAGLVFRDRKEPATWLDRAAGILAGEAEKQILDDGVYGELSSCYHCYALDFYLQVLILARQNGFPLTDSVTVRVRGLLEFLMHLTRPDGSLPLLGDDDGGRALALNQRNYASYRDGLCLGAILFQRGDFKLRDGEFCEEALWMLGEEAWAAYRQLEKRDLPPTQRRFLRSGYVVQRSGPERLDSHLVFDCGGLGILAGGHAHADALSVTLFSRGQEMLTDPGTFVYNCAPEWRSYFRSTAAHNTVTIDGRDQAEPGGTFRWKSRFCCRAGEALQAPGVEYSEGEHDGYVRMQQGVIHRRRVLSTAAGYWIIADDFRGSGEHRFDFHYHFGPAVELHGLEQDDVGVLLRAQQAGLSLRLIAARPISSDLLRGETAPIGGWVSRGYGHKEPAATLRATLTGSVPTGAMTIVAVDRNLIAEPLKIERGSGVACSCCHDGFEDIAVLANGDTELAVADFRMRGEFFWLRLERGVLKQMLAVRARTLERHGTYIFRRTEPESFLGPMHAGMEQESLCAEFVES